MSSCRATSFYLAPGVQRYFRDHTLVAVLPDGSWSEIKHRGDLARIHKEHPDWVGTVLCGSKGGLVALRAELLDNPAQVQRWSVDERVIEGRRPEGPQFVLHRMVWSGLDAVGGAKQVIDAVLPGANKPLQKAAGALVAEYGETAALRLSIACAVRGIVSDDELARMLAEPSVYELQPWLGVEIARFRTSFLRATEHVPQRRGALIRNILSGETLTDSEIVTAIDMADRISPELAERLLHSNRPSLSDIATDIACLHGLSREQHLEILCGNIHNAKSNLAGNIELDARTVEEAYLKGADLKDVLYRVPMTDGLVRGVLAFYKGEHVRDLCVNTRLTNEQLHLVLAAATSQSRSERGNALFRLAGNTSTNDELRIELIRLTLESDEGAEVRRALAECEPHSTAVFQALLETNDTQLSRFIVRSGLLDKEMLRAACDDRDPSTQILAVTELLKGGDIGVEEELKLAEKCEITTWPRLAGIARHTATLELILDKAAALDVDSEAVKLAVSLLDKREVLGLEPGSLAPSGIMEFVVGNRNGAVTQELVNRLALDASTGVAMAALYATGANVAEDVRLQVALNHPEQFIRNFAYKTRECMEELQLTALRELPESSVERRWVVTEAHLAEATQRAIVTRGDLVELVALTTNKCELSGETLQALATHQSPHVRLAVAARRDLHGEALVTLRTEQDDDTQRALLSPRYGGLYDERGERMPETGRDVSLPVSSTPNDTVARQGPREENRDVRNIHVITTRRGVDDLTRSHHPIEYAADPAAVIRESIAEGATTRERFFLDDVSDVRRLPDWGVLPFRSAEAAQIALDGYQCSVTSTELLDDRRRAIDEEQLVGDKAATPQTVALEARVLDSRAAIEQNAEYMGNCTGGYVSAVARGEVQLVGLYDSAGVCQLNIELQRDHDGWRPGEINTRFNGYGRGYENTPDAVRVIADQLAERLNSGQLSAR